MKKITLIIASILTSIISNQANAQNSATASAEASVTLITPISLTKTADLKFGTFVPSSVAGTIIMAPSGTLTVSGGVTEISGGEVSAATFAVTGEAGQTYVITLPSSASTLSSSREGESVSLHDFTSNPSDTGVIGTNGTISVGATLSVPANSAADTYTGSFDVTVNYN